jgi:N-acetylglucosamine-6-phosphate deacetylase
MTTNPDNRATASRDDRATASRDDRVTALSGRIVTLDGVVDGTVHLDGDRIAAVEPGPVDGDAPWIVPGFVDMHCHGGGGYTFTTGDPAEARGAAAFHTRHGTTTVVASLVSSPFEVMLAATKAYAPLVAGGTLGGVHFEGPYLSEACCGAQNPAYLRDPSLDELRALIEAGPDAIKMMTIAPERDGALEAIDFLARHRIVPAVGHTDATYQQVIAAVAAGARAGTHVFNGMRPPHHRAPGPAYALLGTDEIVCEFVADGVHMADETLGFATKVVGPTRAALITDAIAATGMPDGGYDLGGQAVTVAAGVARLTTADGSPGAIAGSTLTMDAAFRRATRVTGSIVFAAQAASTNPARVLALHDRGVIAGGRRADLVILDHALSITGVLSGGVAV